MLVWILLIFIFSLLGTLVYFYFSIMTAKTPVRQKPLLRRKENKPV